MPTREGHSKGVKIITGVLVSLFLSFVFASCLNLAMQKPLNHDEHQFVAVPELLATRGLFPYLGCPQFHMPNLVFVYGLIFTFTDHVLLPARLFSVACAFVLVLTVFLVGRHAFRELHPVACFLFAAGGVLLLLSNPLFIWTSGRAWNHDFPTLLAVLAFLLHCRAARQSKPAKLLFVSGLLLGLAIGTRISFAPLVVPFAGILLFHRGSAAPEPRVVSSLLPWGCGALAGVLPTLVLFLLAPGRFLYSMISYHELEPVWRHELNLGGHMSLGEKLAFARNVMGEPGNLVLVLAFVWLGWLPRIVLDRERHRKYFEVMFVWILLPFLVIGALVPTPTFRQYLYAPIPFLVLGVLYGVSSLRTHEKAKIWPLQFFALAAIVCCAYWPSEGRLSPHVVSTRTWYPVQAHETGLELRAIVGKGKVLTLAPLFPLEAGLDIYPEFASGAFAWRRAHLIPADMRKKLGVVGKMDLDALLENDPPAAILVGYEQESGLEDAFIEYAQSNGYTALELPEKKTLWLAPD
jgi:4-amino-4-deoxy-L-arabinose transferase-like glycosyltransferase